MSGIRLKITRKKIGGGGGGGGESSIIWKFPFNIGRGRDNNMKISDSKISSKHCIIHMKKVEGDEHLILEDLSTYGTYINGVKVAGLTRIPEQCELALTMDHVFKLQCIRGPLVVQEEEEEKEEKTPERREDEGILTPWGVKLRRSHSQKVDYDNLNDSRSSAISGREEREDVEDDAEEVAQQEAPPNVLESLRQNVRSHGEGLRLSLGSRDSTIRETINPGDFYPSPPSMPLLAAMETTPEASSTRQTPKLPSANTLASWTPSKGPSAIQVCLLPCSALLSPHPLPIPKMKSP